MSITNVAIVSFLILIVVMTFVAEPRLSFEYYKAVGSSATNVMGKIKDMVAGAIESYGGKEGKEDD